MAGAAALWSARQGRKTLLASTNPVHSLSNLFAQDVFGKPAVVCEEDNCYAFEIDTRETIERSKREIREKINWFLKFADITTKAEDFIESATMNPAFEESAMFYVFDTAPTANARRLLGMSKVYSLWVEKMLKSREEAKSLRELLSFSKKKEEKDPLLEYLLSFKDRMASAKDVLTDKALTAFFFVTLPESLPIAVNGLIQKSQVGEDAAEFVQNRVKMQEEHMAEIAHIFNDNVRAIVPLFETEIQGTPMLLRFMDQLFKA